MQNENHHQNNLALNNRKFNQISNPNLFSITYKQLDVFFTVNDQIVDEKVMMVDLKTISFLRSISGKQNIMFNSVQRLDNKVLIESI